MVLEDTANVELALELTEGATAVLDAAGLTLHGDGEGVLTTWLARTPLIGDLVERTQCSSPLPMKGDGD